MDPFYTVFDTVIGHCAIAWSAAGLVGVWLPEADAAATRREVLRTWPTAVEAPPPADVVDRIRALLAGAPDDLADLTLDDLGVGAFAAEVYRITRGIRPGSTLSYGQIAAELGQPGAAQAVGRALGANPWPIVVPCHRVLAANGSMHGFSAPGGIHTKRRMLQSEKAIPEDEPTLF